MKLIVGPTYSSGLRSHPMARTASVREHQFNGQVASVRCLGNAHHCRLDSLLPLGVGCRRAAGEISDRHHLPSANVKAYPTPAH